MSTPPRWTNRIVGHADVDPTTLTANDLNWRRHPKSQADALLGVINSVGLVQSVIVNRRSQRIVDGHLRVALAVEKREPTIPVVYVDLADDEERLILATLDPLAAMAETDADALRDLLASVTVEDEAVTRLVSFLARESDDPVAEWEGMPAFEQANEMPFRTIAIHFADQDGVDSFAALVSQHVTEQTKWLWHPAQPRVARQDLQWVSDEA